MNKRIGEKDKKIKGSDSKGNIRHSFFRTIGMMEYYFDQLEQEKSRIIAKAKEAKKGDDEATYRALKKRFTVCLANMRLVSEMISQIEIALQLDSMDRMVENYRSCMEAFEKQQSIVNSIKKLSDVRGSLEIKIDSYNKFCEDLSFNDREFFEDGDGYIVDSDFDRIIAVEIEHDAKENTMLDEKIQFIRRKIKEVNEP